MRRKRGVAPGVRFERRAARVLPGGVELYHRGSAGMPPVSRLFTR